MGVVAVGLFWAGMILGVSFLATAVKFLAPSLSLSVALDVGRHTFGVFNAVEIGWSLVLIALVLWRPGGRWVYAMATVPCAIVALETAWLLPVLDARVGVILAGGMPSPSNLHVFYILLEALKLVALLALGFWSLCHLPRMAPPRAVAPTSGDADSPSCRTGSVPAPANEAQVLRLVKRRPRQ